MITQIEYFLTSTFQTKIKHAGVNSHISGLKKTLTKVIVVCLQTSLTCVLSIPENQLVSNDCETYVPCQ